MMQSLGDCTNWFLFVISGDQTTPTTRFWQINCLCATTSFTAGDVAPGDTEIRFAEFTTEGRLTDAGKFPTLIGSQWGPVFAKVQQADGKGEIIQIVNKKKENTLGITWNVLRGQFGSTAQVIPANTRLCLITTHETVLNYFSGRCKKGIKVLNRDEAGLQ